MKIGGMYGATFKIWCAAKPRKQSNPINEIKLQIQQTCACICVFVCVSASMSSNNFIFKLAYGIEWNSQTKYREILQHHHQKAFSN